MTLLTRGNPSIMVHSRNHEQHGQFYYVCMIWYLDEARLWQMSVEKHISLTVNSFALTQLRSASVAHQAYCCKIHLLWISTKALGYIIMPLKNRLVVVISWNQQWFTEEKKPSQWCFLWSSIKTFTYLRLRKSGPVDLAWDTSYLIPFCVLRYLMSF